jgi:hypothetical protein
MRRCTAVLIILVSFAVSFAGAAFPDNTRQAVPVVTGPELNMTGADIGNYSIPARYEITPTLINIKVEISDTDLPGPKGEMAAGPRTIGFSADPVTLILLIVAIIGGIAGIWYLVRRKPEEPEEEDE